MGELMDDHAATEGKHQDRTRDKVLLIRAAAYRLNSNRFKILKGLLP